MARLLERAGNSDRGGITGIYTVLVEGDDFNEPVADSVRSILDGHVVLSRRLASASHFPAIEITESSSRVRDQIVSADQRQAANHITSLVAAYREKEDLIAVGAYQAGTDATLDAAVALRGPTNDFLRQNPEDASDFAETRDLLLALAEHAHGEVTA